LLEYIVNVSVQLQKDQLTIKSVYLYFIPYYYTTIQCSIFDFFLIYSGPPLIPLISLDVMTNWY